MLHVHVSCFTVLVGYCITIELRSLVCTSWYSVSLARVEDLDKAWCITWWEHNRSRAATENSTVVQRVLQMDKVNKSLLCGTLR